MPDFNQCVMEFSFEFGTIDHKAMNIELSTPTVNMPIIIDPNDTNDTKIILAKVIVDLPTQIMLKFSGKDYNTDTIVDENGKILQDVFVKILSVKMDGFLLNEKFLHQKIKIITDQGQEYITAYIGFNGTITLDFVENNVFSQYLKLNS